MKPWELVNKELQARSKDWYWLRDQLDIPIQTINHWKARGVPAKYNATIEKILDKPPGWITGDALPFAPPSELSAAAIEMAVLFDMIPASDRLRRIQAWNAATSAIMKVLQPSSAIGQVELDQESK